MANTQVDQEAVIWGFLDSSFRFGATVINTYTLLMYQKLLEILHCQLLPGNK